MVKHCGKCLHLDVCKTADSCDGHVPNCKHFLDKEEHPKLKHGRWKDHKNQGITVCTECSFERSVDENFGRAVACPNCGAKMDGGN